MKFFFDRNTSVHIARMIDHFDRQNNIVHQDDDIRFEPDSEDVHIIQTLASEPEKPVWITKDLRQRKNPAERAALRGSGMTLFFLKRPPPIPHHEALKILYAWPTIVEKAINARVPTAFEVPMGTLRGKLTVKIDTVGNTSDL